MKFGQLACAAAMAALAPICANATGLKPGLYTIVGAGTQQICLLADGTWYSPSFANWAGQWQVFADGNTHIFGNYNSGAGNDSIVVGRSKNWTEWTDDLSFVSNSDPITFTRTGRCSAATTSTPAVAQGNPNGR